MSVRYLDLADFLAIAEMVLEAPSESIVWVPRLEHSESALHSPTASFGGAEFYPELTTDADSSFAATLSSLSCRPPSQV